MNLATIEAALQDGDVALENRRSQLLELVRIIRRQEAQIGELKDEITVLKLWKKTLIECQGRLEIEQAVNRAIVERERMR